MYHRVADTDCDPWGLCVSPTNFASQLEQLARRHVILSMNDFVARLGSGTLPMNAVAITFDDGYLDNWTEAAPILAQFAVPATLFLTTGPTLERSFYWWDELAALVLDAGEHTINIDLGGSNVSAELGAREAADADRQNWRAWDTPRTRREAVYYQLWNLLRPLPPAELTATMTRLRALFDHEPIVCHRPMTEEEIRELVAASPFTLAGHTRDHADLPAIGGDLALEQMIAGKKDAEMVGRETLTGFAYPYGRHDAQIMDLAVTAGFSWACTTVPGHVHDHCDVYALPRIAAKNVPDIQWLQ